MIEIPEGHDATVIVKRNRTDLTEEQCLHVIGVLNSYGIAKHLSWDYSGHDRSDGVPLYTLYMEFEGDYVDWNVD